MPHCLVKNYKQPSCPSPRKWHNESRYVHTGNTGQSWSGRAIWTIFYCYFLLKELPSGASDKEPTCQCRRCKRLGFDPWGGKILEEGMANPFWYFCLDNPMDRGVWRATVHRDQTRLKWLSMHTRSFLKNRWCNKCIFRARKKNIKE